MPTSIPTVKVTPHTDGHGFLITCNQHPDLQLTERTRPLADQTARDHQNAHARRSQ